MGHELEGGAHHGDRIDTVMLEEALILIGEQRVEIARIDLRARGRQPPAPFAGDIGPKQFAVTVEHHARDFEIAPKRRRPKRLEHAGDAAGQRGEHPHRADRGEHRAPLPFVLALYGCTHFAGATSTAPVSVRPNRSGRYMSSTTAWGST